MAEYIISSIPAVAGMAGLGIMLGLILSIPCGIGKDTATATAGSFDAEDCRECMTCGGCADPVQGTHRAGHSRKFRGNDESGPSGAAI